MGWFNGSKKRLQIPLFIIGFVGAAALRTLVPAMASLWSDMAALARECLVLTLFLVGSGMTREALRRVGIRALLHGVTLWLTVGSMTLLALTFIGLK